MKLLIINGPNLNMLHKRDAQHYGSKSLDEIADLLLKAFPHIEFAFEQSNSEGDIINLIQKADSLYHGLVINPAAYSHYSLAIRDALELCTIPKIEVHLSNIFGREGFRKESVTAASCNGVVTGLKEISYYAAVAALMQILEKR